jgi:hypothetical protein
MSVGYFWFLFLKGSLIATNHGCSRQGLEGGSSYGFISRGDEGKGDYA